MTRVKSLCLVRDVEIFELLLGLEDLCACVVEMSLESFRDCIGLSERGVHQRRQGGGSDPRNERAVLSSLEGCNQLLGRRRLLEWSLRQRGDAEST